MKIKTKLLIGFGLLFMVVIFFGVVSIYYIEDISDYSNKTLTNNYETLTFTREMRSVLDKSDLPLSANAAETFGKALKKQESNITEPGEKEATASVREGFEQLTDGALNLDKKQQAEKTVRAGLHVIDGLNMKAIVDKNNSIHDIVSKATVRVAAIVFITFLILFIFIVNFPGFILKPLNEFIGGVHEIARKNYDARLEFAKGDEFSGLASEFNRMAASLAADENKGLTDVLSCENRIKVLIEEIPAAVIGLDENQEILFLNMAARKILNLEEKMANGHPIKTLVNNEELLNQILDSKAGGGSLKVSIDGKPTRFEIKTFEIVAPNLKQEPFGTLQFSGFPAGMIYILKNTDQNKPEKVKSI
jgi:NtrC-family two-component system sensor histidine kinase KinB